MVSSIFLVILFLGVVVLSYFVGVWIFAFVSGLKGLPFWNTKSRVYRFGLKKGGHSVDV